MEILLIITITCLLVLGTIMITGLVVIADHLDHIMTLLEERKGKQP